MEILLETEVQETNFVKLTPSNPMLAESPMTADLVITEDISDGKNV